MQEHRIVNWENVEEMVDSVLSFARPFAKGVSWGTSSRVRDGSNQGTLESKIALNISLQTPS